MGKSTRNLVIGSLVGLGVGYATGILTAKKSGKETRQDIAKATMDAKHKADETIKSLHSDLDNLLKQGEELLKNTKNVVKDEFVKALEAAKKARDNALEVIKAINEGDASDADLSDAISEANKAIDHLKTYLGKDNTSSK